MDLSVTQNFINDPNLIKELIKKTSINKNDIVYDLGAGEGQITEELIKVAGKVIAVEFDDKYFDLLKKRFGQVSNVTLLREDLVKFDIPESHYKVFSNIPFNITSRIINKLFLDQNIPESAYIIMQREAAKRFMGEGEGYLISKLIKPFYSLKILHEFKRTDFNPVPRVDIVILSFTKNNLEVIKESDKTLYRDFTTYVFLQQKPNLKSRLGNIFSYKQITHLYKKFGFSAKTPASEISDDTWIGIFKAFMEFVPQNKRDIVSGSYKKYKQDVANAPIGSRTKSRIIK